MSKPTTDFINPYAAAHWDLVPGRTAIVLVDLQNDFLHPDGWYAKSGIDIGHMRRVIEPTRELLEVAREQRVPVIWTRHGFRNQHDAGEFFRLRPFLRGGGLRHGTWGYRILEDMAPADDDWYVEKNRLSAFYNTNLELILRGLSAETVIVNGVLTNQCVAATSKDASFRDFKPILVEECTGTTLPHLHEPALEMARVGWCEVSGLGHVIDGIRGFPTEKSRNDL
jgi:nicotinamidase-related amidase